MALLGTLEGAWVAIQVRVNREWTVAEELARHGYEHFLPTYDARPATRRRRPASPLFPGYLFCRYTLLNPFRIVQVTDVRRIVGMGHIPLPVPEDEVESIRRVLSLGAYSEPWRFLEIGQRVKISHGPLRGIEGILISVRNSLRVVVAVTLLRRAVAVEVEAEHVLAQDAAFAQLVEP